MIAKHIVVGLLVCCISLNAKELVKIPEASGICYIDKTDMLVVVNDEGWIYKLTPKGKIKRKFYLGDYDLEGITYDKINDKLLVAVEGAESILVLNRASLELEKEVKIKRKFQDVKLLKKSKKAGIEAIAIDENGDIYLSNQSKKTYKNELKENVSVVFKIDSLEKKKANIVEVYNHGYIDIAGLTFHEGYLYMTSDKQNLLIKYDIKTNKTIKKVKLPKSAQEGICFDNAGYVYIADDEGAILRYKAKKLGI
jgi:uncharacterized protein YjiK